MNIVKQVGTHNTSDEHGLSTQLAGIETVKPTHAECRESHDPTAQRSIPRGYRKSFVYMAAWILVLTIPLFVSKTFAEFVDHLIRPNETGWDIIGAHAGAAVFLMILFLFVWHHYQSLHKRDIDEACREMGETPGSATAGKMRAVSMGLSISSAHTPFGGRIHITDVADEVNGAFVAMGQKVGGLFRRKKGVDSPIAVTDAEGFNADTDYATTGTSKMTLRDIAEGRRPAQTMAQLEDVPAPHLDGGVSSAPRYTSNDRRGVGVIPDSRVTPPRVRRFA
jgi:hypothetical protein